MTNTKKTKPKNNNKNTKQNNNQKMCEECGLWCRKQVQVLTLLLHVVASDQLSLLITS